jgi:hypothetical protein
MFGFPLRLPLDFAKVQKFHLNRRGRQSVRLAGDSTNWHAQSSDQNGEGIVGHEASRPVAPETKSNKIVTKPCLAERCIRLSLFDLRVDLGIGGNFTNRE